MKKILLAFGTRPEAIKMAPLYLAMKARHSEIQPIVCVTAQHRQMLDGVLDFFGIKPEFDLNVMQARQDLFDVTSSIVTGMKSVLRDVKPDWTLVHGDTTTSFSVALAAYYEQRRIGHVEAGLRSHNKYSPFPEEINRRLTATLSDIHFAPTSLNRNNLLAEGVSPQSIHVTGNTVIDALFLTRERVVRDGIRRDQGLCDRTLSVLDSKRPMVLVTAHRRENFGAPLERICSAVRSLAVAHPDAFIVWPVHPNPNVRETVSRAFAGHANVHLIEPQDYEPFVYLMNRASVILTDSGGVQEEAPSLGKPVLVMREVTERTEALESGTVELVGTDTEKIIARADFYLYGPGSSCAAVGNPYGDGQACERIIDAILSDGR